MNRCIRLFNNITEWKWFEVPEMVQLFVYLICKADHEAYQSDGRSIERGSFECTRKEITDKLKMTDTKYRTCIRRLVAENRISVFSGTFDKKSLITIRDFSRYVPEEISMSGPAKFEATSNIPISPGRAVAPEMGSASVQTQLKLDPIEQKAEEVRRKINNNSQIVVDLFHSYCPSLPRVMKLSMMRKNKIAVRMKEMEQDYELLKKVFQKTEESKFLNGDNDRGWKASFDWIFANSQNWVKILEGKYDDQNIYKENGRNHKTPEEQRNELASASQKCDILATLAKCQEEYETGNLPPFPSIEAEI